MSKGIFRMPKVVFRLKRFWVVGGKTVDLYQEIKEGRKTIEYRKATFYWFKRLVKGVIPFKTLLGKLPVDLTNRLLIRKAWFTVGYPENNLPRLETDITRLVLDPVNKQLQIHIGNVEEVVA